MESYKSKLEAHGYVIKQEIQYWSLEHSQKGIYQVRSGDLESVCKAWWQEFEAPHSQAA